MTLKGTALLRTRILVARAHDLWGWAGWLGIASLAAALFIAGSVRMQRSQSPAMGPKPEARAPALLPKASSLQRPGLPALSELSTLLQRLEQTAVASGVGWPAAEYRLVAATETEPASLEVHCRLKAPYPKLRAMVTAAMTSTPGLTLRDLSLSRSSSTTSDVDAKLVLAILFMDASPIPSASRQDKR